ncbi:MAG: hypothetical protein AAFX87_00675 [Bacteroidota bacterium]
MTDEQQQLWQAIRRFEIDDPSASFSFTDRLARENDWSLEYAIRVVYEYKKFMFLICVSDHPLTPSDQVDQAWHLHLIYTHSYWADFCQNTINRQIHHGPTKGGQTEKDKYHDWYEETKKSYIAKFGNEPPEDIWPSSKVRFGEIVFSRVNRHRFWIIPKPTKMKKLWNTLTNSLRQKPNS